MRITLKRSPRFLIFRKWMKNFVGPETMRFINILYIIRTTVLKESFHERTRIFALQTILTTYLLMTTWKWFDQESNKRGEKDVLAFPRNWDWLTSDGWRQKISRLPAAYEYTVCTGRLIYTMLETAVLVPWSWC